MRIAMIAAVADAPGALCERHHHHDSNESRAANLSGGLDVDGAAADRSDAPLIRGVAGSILR
jgi:hypothetical protein